MPEGEDPAAAPVEDAPAEVVEAAPIEPIGPETLAAHLKIAAAFRVFDHENNNTVDVRELGTVIRSLGCCPSEADLNDLLLECEEEDSSGYIKYERFEPMMFKSSSEDEILRAFQIMDTETQGFMTEDQLSKYLCEEGEKFTPEEFEEMMSAAKDVDKGVIYYDEHAQLLALEDPQ
eukprot:gene12265-27565_t